MPQIRFAIIDDNMLTCLGLQQLLTRLLPMAECTVFSSVDELKAHTDENYLHFFVSSRNYFEHAVFFRQYPHKSIVLVSGDMHINDVYTINVCQSESVLIRDIMNVQRQGHAIAAKRQHPDEQPLLSPRETEVAVLICKGLINKEIADRLNVSLNTIITHRKNIMEKLHARSIVDIIIHCVLNGIVAIEEL